MGRARLKAGVWTANDLRDYDGPLLLDTHVWIWYMDGDSSRLSSETADLLNRSGAKRQLHVSDISYWEVAVKAAKKKLTFSVDVGVWLQQAETAPGIQFLPLTRPVLLQSTRLAGSVHNDPVDRMLIAIAQLHAVPLVTADGNIVDYAKFNGATPVVDVM